jgi:hypothetical protein
VISVMVCRAELLSPTDASKLRAYRLRVKCKHPVSSRSDGIDGTRRTPQIPIMASDNPQMMLRAASAEEKDLLHEIARLAGSPNFNAWAMQIVRKEAEAVLREKAPNDLPKFIESRMKK